jgi:hypothetical protein
MARPTQTPQNKNQEPIGGYIAHFFKFLAVFIFIIGVSLFLFSFTAGA